MQLTGITEINIESALIRIVHLFTASDGAAVIPTSFQTTPSSGKTKLKLFDSRNQGHIGDINAYFCKQKPSCGLKNCQVGSLAARMVAIGLLIIFGIGRVTDALDLERYMKFQETQSRE